MSRPKGELKFGRCEEVLAEFPENYFTAVITDPPYGLSANPDMFEVMRAWGRGEPYLGDSAGFMGREWDSFVPGPDIWNEVMRTLQPGGHILSFSGTRTYDLMVAGMDMAAENHDCRLSGYHSWVYGSGFPKSMDLSKAIEKKLGAERTEGGREWSGGQRSSGIMGDNQGTQERNIVDVPATEVSKLWEGYGTAMKPAHEPVAEYVKGGGDPLIPESIFHYIPKPNQKERHKGCKNLFWLMDGDDTKRITKEEYEELKDSKEHRVSQGNVWPTVKPIELMRRLIRMTKKPGRKNVILEPFMGSGTTIIAAILEGCDYVGIDADPVAFDISKARVHYFKCLGELGLK
jgi:site-specific DNA-methyltransferase (adenine-specific)